MYKWENSEEEHCPFNTVRDREAPGMNDKQLALHRCCFGIHRFTGSGARKDSEVTFIDSLPVKG